MMRRKLPIRRRLARQLGIQAQLQGECKRGEPAVEKDSKNFTAHDRWIDQRIALAERVGSAGQGFACSCFGWRKYRPPHSSLKLMKMLAMNVAITTASTK
jgi:hypothetical protein